jgi:hypothetical protein
MNIFLKRIEDEQGSRILHNNRTNVLDLFLLHKLNNSIFHNDLQQCMWACIEEMIAISMPSYERKSCTFQTQGEITTNAYKYARFLVISAITNMTSFTRINRKEEEMLVTFMLQGFWNWTTSKVKVESTCVTSIGEATIETTTSITREQSTNVRYLWDESELVLVKLVSLLIW